MSKVNNLNLSNNKYATGLGSVANTTSINGYNAKERVGSTNRRPISNSIINAKVDKAYVIRRPNG